jgi:hypothetical protein
LRRCSSSAAHPPTHLCPSLPSHLWRSMGRPALARSLTAARQATTSRRAIWKSVAGPTVTAMVVAP